MLNRIITFTVIFSCITLSLLVYTEANGTYIKLSTDKQELPAPKMYSVEDMEKITQHTEIASDTIPEQSEVKLPSKEDVDCLSKNIYFESRNQSILGQLMVALVTIERKNFVRYPKSICGVVYERKQFSWTNTGKNKKPKLNNEIEREAWDTAQTIAKFTLIIDTHKPLLNITHYHTLAVKPKWSTSKTLKAAYVINDHIFYKEQRG